MRGGDVALLPNLPGGLVIELSMLQHASLNNDRCYVDDGEGGVERFDRSKLGGFDVQNKPRRYRSIIDFTCRLPPYH